MEHTGTELAMEKEDKELSARVMIVFEPEHKQQQMATDGVDLKAELVQREEIIATREAALISRQAEYDVDMKELREAKSVIIAREDIMLVQEINVAAQENAVTALLENLAEKYAKKEENLVARENAVTVLLEDLAEKYAKREEIMAEREKDMAALEAVIERDLIALKQHRDEDEREIELVLGEMQRRINLVKEREEIQRRR